MQAFPSSTARTMAKRGRRHNRCMADLPAEQGSKRLLFSEEKKKQKRLCSFAPTAARGRKRMGLVA